MKIVEAIVWVLINACLLGAAYAFVVGLFYYTQNDDMVGSRWIDMAQFCMVSAAANAVIMECRRRRQP